MRRLASIPLVVIGCFVIAFGTLAVWADHAVFDTGKVVGTTQEVLVTDQGFIWDGATYRSLSAIAFAITGAKWNGRRFFGLLKGRGAYG